MSANPGGNRLARESSPYLQQHADNPVDWYPWCDAAFELARRTDRPVLLSIGYSSCHWCHVMAHESFEDSKTAELMNDRFVNIKVDREERPDVDRIYQLAQQLLTQRPGGWPLTMFLDPTDQQPFFGGTYFPNEARHGMPAFIELLTRVADFYAEQRDEVASQTAQLARIFEQLEPQAGENTVKLDATPLQDARKKLNEQFDREYGGLGGAPKFPHPATLEHLLRQWRASAHQSEPDVDALYLVSLTLKRMADGGIRDHVGGGFCRYSVDRYWQIPHFEKMLYDNGPLLAIYAQTALATGEPEFHDIARETADWLLRSMQSPEGGFYASFDADSEGEEGRFYVWTPDEVRALLNEDEYQAMARLYGLDRDANFEGRWHLTVQEDSDALATELGLNKTELKARVDEARRKLFAAREQRVPPERDDKQLSAWNGLAIRGLAIAGRSLESRELTGAAQRATDFVRNHLFVDGRLLASYMDGIARFPAYLDDHAFMLDALLELLQNEWRPEDLDFAVALADLLLEFFFDDKNGGFFFTANDHEALIMRPKSMADEALPSGAGVAALALQRLGFMLGESRYLDAAEKTLKHAWPALLSHPHAHVSLLNALQEYLQHPEIVIIRGDATESRQWRDAANRIFAPQRLVFAIDDGIALPGALAARVAKTGETVAWRCSGSVCSLPITRWEALAAVLRES
ncbi:MAG: thioredoxin domain-containing protein [Woeseia sp.]|nr:thioredoxin domain-containing protein [Woeseia sp.]MBT8096964.1 thioredoxin domain-containing protein [Woeseia sp.]NNE61829.1 thioredoxin domain-containing protein [Woeseia sp.]NNL54612.1 thioredoxin domain-containing protein [Woeseia sp.]